MAQERRSPLPVGKYWVDVYEKDWGMFQDWLDRNRSIVKVIATEQYDEEDPKRQWFLFQVTGGPGGEFLPQWDGPGFPTIADAAINSSQDTSTLQDAIDHGRKEDAERWEKLQKAAIALGVVSGIWGLVKFIREIRELKG